MRTGTVVSGTADNLVILVGGTSFRAQALESYAPVEGDLVAVLRNDATWLVLGRMPGAGPNEVCDFSFEDTTAGLPPADWVLYNITGTSSVETVARGGAPGGNQVARVTPLAVGTSESYLYSCPIEVSPGQRWDLSAYVGALYTDSVAADADADLVALWFANDTDLYPTTVSADSTVASLDDVTALPPFTGISGTATVPSGASVMRVALRSSLVADQSLEWDFVTARLVTEGQTPSAGLGRVPNGWASITSSAPAVTTTHTIAYTTAPITFVSGRAYRVKVKGYVQSSVSGDSVRIRVLKTGIGGQGAIDTFSGMVINGTNGMTTFYHENVIRVLSTNPTLTDDLNVTYVRQTGTGNVFLGATGANPSWLEVVDIGRAEDYPGANSFV